MIETQTDKPSVTFTIPSWILAIGKLVDYAAKNVSDGVKNAVEELKGSDQTNDTEQEDEKPKVEHAENVTPPSKKFKFHFKRTNLNISRKLKLEKLRGLKNSARMHPKIALVVLVIVLMLGFITFKIAKPHKATINGANSATSSENSSTKINVNKKFDVSIKTQDGKETGDKLHVTITTIEKTDSIIAQDKPVRTKDGKIFLLVNMEIENTTKQELAIKPNDMVRFIDNEGRSFAPEVYNNGVKADAVSIKKTRVGYVVDSAQNTYKLMIGEVRVKQEQIEVSF